LKFIQTLFHHFNFHIPQEQYNITVKHIISLTGGKTLLLLYKSSPIRLIQSLQPHLHFHPFLFPSVPRNYWNEEENHKQFASYLSQKFTLKTTQDWYKLNLDHFTNHGRGLLSSYYFDSPFLFASKHAQDLPLPWKFRVHGVWEDTIFHREYLDSLMMTLKMQLVDQLYSISSKQIKGNGGGGLLSSRYRDSPSLFVSSVIPEKEWFMWRFDTVGQGYWKSRENRKKFFLWMGDRVGFRDIEDWYEISLEMIKDLGGNTLSHFYSGSPVKFVMDMVPEHNWVLWEFKNAPRNVWENVGMHKQFFHWLGEKFKIREESGYLDFGVQSMIWERYSSILKHYKTPIHFIKKFLSNRTRMKHDMLIRNQTEFWNSGWTSKTEKYFSFLIGTHLFPSVSSSFRHKISDEGNYRTEIDVFLPSLSIGFEYQGEQHYTETGRVLQELTAIKSRDERKEVLCEKIGISLIPIPYWSVIGTSGDTGRVGEIARLVKHIRCDLLV